MDAVLGEGRPPAQSNFRSSSASMPMMAKIFRRVPLAMSRPAWTGTTTVRPSGWRITRWLPLILTTVNPARPSALTTFAPGTAGRDPGIRRRQGSASAHPEGRPRRATLPARPVGRQPRLPPLVRHLQPRRPGAAVRRRTRRRPHPVLRHRAHGLRGSQHRFSHTDSPAPISAPVVLGSTEQSSTRSRGLVAFWAARPTGRDRLDKPSVRELVGEQGMPTPFSRQRRRAAAESGHNRPFPVTRSLDAVESSLMTAHQRGAGVRIRRAAPAVSWSRITWLVT